MESLLKEMAKRNMTDMSFMIINGVRYARSVSELTRRVSFPVYQEARNQSLWSLLNGKKDDFLIYDQCGRLAYHITFPHSNLPFGYIRYFLVKTYQDSPCGECVPPTTMTTTTASPTNITSTNQDASVVMTSPTEHVNEITSQVTKVKGGKTTQGKVSQEQRRPDNSTSP